MRTGAGLALICVGAILAFAVTTNTSVFNLHTAGWVLMVIGAIGLAFPRRTYGWLGSRLVRRTRTYRGGVVEDTAVRPYMTYEPGSTTVRRGLPQRSTVVMEEPAEPVKETEVVEDIYEP